MKKLEALDWMVVVVLLASAAAIIALSLLLDDSEREVRSLRDQLATANKLSQLERETADALIGASESEIKRLTADLVACSEREGPNLVCTLPVRAEKRPVPVFERGRIFDE